MGDVRTVHDLQEYLLRFAPDRPIKVVAAELDEVHRAAQRCREEAIYPTQRPLWDGTPCILLPEVLWNRLCHALRGLEE